MNNENITGFYTAEQLRSHSAHWAKSGHDVTAAMLMQAAAAEDRLAKAGEPVAYRYALVTGKWTVFLSKARAKFLADEGAVVEPLYAAPPTVEPAQPVEAAVVTDAMPTKHVRGDFEKTESGGISDYDCGYMDGWNNCLANVPKQPGISKGVSDGFIEKVCEVHYADHGYAWESFTQEVADKFRAKMRYALTTALAQPLPMVEVQNFDRARETPRRQQAVEKLLALGWTYHHENGWTAPTGEQAGEVDPVEYQCRMRMNPEQAGRDSDWSHWESCCPGRYEDLKRIGEKPGLGFESQWHYQVRKLYAQPRPMGVPDGPLTGKYADVLVPFVALMERELHANAGKGDRPGWLSMTRKVAVLEIHHHVAKLQKAVLNFDNAGVREYAADVANMSMMAVDVCGALIAAAPAPAKAGEA